MLRLDRVRALVDVYPGVDREDEMVAAFDYCLHGKGGAAPSIDTAMHGLVDAAHVDHLHPDSGIAIATAADGEELTKEIFGDKVAWVPWRRPGFQLGPGHRRDQAAPTRRRSAASSAATASPPGATRRDEAEANSLGIIRTAEAVHRRRTGQADPFGRVVAGLRAAPRRRAPAPGRGLAPDDPRARVAPTGRRSATSPTPTSCSTSSPAEQSQRLAALGTSCPDHFLRTKVRPWSSTCPATAPARGLVARLRELHTGYREQYAACYLVQAGATGALSGGLAAIREVVRVSVRLTRFEPSPDRGAWARAEERVRG